MKRHGFTILELLLVLGLSAAMLTIAVSAFYRTMRGSATENAARELMGKISAARAYAASSRTDVAIVFPRNETNVDNSLKYSAYRVCEVDISGSNINFKRWVPGENWTYLPNGVVIGRRFYNNSQRKAEDVLITDQFDDAFKIPDSSDIKKAAEKVEDPLEPSKKIEPRAAHNISNVPVGLNNTNTTTIANAIVIRMDGMLYNLQPVLIRLKQGTVNSSGTVTLTPPNQADYLPLTVLFNGKVKLFRELVSE